MSEQIEYNGRAWTIPDDVAERLSGPTFGAGRMQRLVLGLLYAHRDDDELPTNGRFVFYELEGLGHVRKSRQGESRRGGVDTPREQEVTEALSELRKRQVVPWDWIADETRTLHHWRTADSIAEYLTDTIAMARLNPWSTAPPLLLCESRSLAGVLASLASEYRCAIAATNGQAGGFLHTDIVPFLEGNDRPVRYLGDLDHQGAQIEANTRAVLEREAGRSIPWERIALTREQVDLLDLDPVWKTDSRYKDGGKTGPAWECEALKQGPIVQLVRDTLDGLLPEPLGAVLEREAAERDEWVARLGGQP